MAEPVVRIEPSRVSVEPGGLVTVLVTVYNPGNVVEGYHVDVVSETPMPWASASPSTLSVYPQQEATTIVTFAPPGGPGTPGGSFAFGVRLRSQVDAQRSAVAEGDIDIGAQSGLQASITPVTSSGRWRGNHILKVENWGNSPARLRVVAADPDQELGFLLVPQVLDVPLGGQKYARIKVRTRHPVLRGTTRRLPFKVVCEPDVPAGPPGPLAVVSTPDRPVLDGGFNQKPILSRWVVLGAAVLLLALVALPLWLWQRSGSESEAEELALPPDRPGNLASTVEPGIITLMWDKVPDADGYEIEMTKPANQTTPANAQPLPGNDNRVAFAMKTDRGDQHCYVVFAVKDGAPNSAGSKRICQAAVLTPQQVEKLEKKGPPTTPAVIQPAPAGEPTEDPSPSSDGPTSPTATSTATESTPTATATTPTATATTPSATATSSLPTSASTSATVAPPPTGPPAFIVPLKPYSADLSSTEASADQLAAVRAGLPVTLARTKDLVVPEDFPTGLPLVLYVGADTESEALAFCESAKLLEEFAASALCFKAYPFTASPTPTPTPTATGAALQLKVAHANIYTGLSPAEFDEDLAVVLADAPDVATLNETYNRSLTQLSPSGYAVWRAETPPDARETPVLWRTDSWELLDYGTELMHQQTVKWGTRYVNWVTLRSRTTGSTVSVISGHASPGGRGRDGLLHAFVARLDQLTIDLEQQGPVIIGADLNTNYPRSGFLSDWLAGSGAHSTFDTLGEPTGGWATGNHRGATIDYVLVAGGQAIEHATSHLPHSDHRLLTATVLLP